MKTKKIVSLILAIIMVVGLLPMSAIAQSNAVATVLGTGKWTDKNVNPDGSYKYVVEGEDGSREVVTLLSPTTDMGNKKDKIMSKDEVYYQQVNPQNLPESTCLIVNKNKVALSNTLGTSPVVEIKNDDYRGTHIAGEVIDSEWTIDGDKDGKISIYSPVKAQYLSIKTAGNFQNSTKLNFISNLDRWETWEKNGGYGIHYHGGSIYRFYLKTYTSSVSLRKEDQFASPNLGNEEVYNFYSKHVVAEDMYTINADELQKLIDEAHKRDEFQKTYTESSWTDFKAALKNAEDAVNQTKDSTGKKILYPSAQADEMVNNLNVKHVELKNAIERLKHDFAGDNKCVKPKITWHRSYGDGKKPPKDERVENINSVLNQGPDYPIIWDWNKVKDIKATMGNAFFTENGKSIATWEDTDKEWTTSSVRRFTGTFIWPHGYTLNDKATVVSKNDANYQAIYNYINNNSALKARYGNSKVIAVNDNMYLFISKADDKPMNQWSEQDAQKHMVFWSGTDGKGIWTHRGTKGSDADRTTPTSCLGKNATPAYRHSWPNLIDIPGNGNNDNVINFWDSKNSNIQQRDENLKANLSHTDGWYTLVDTSAAMSTMTGLYGATTDLGGQEMRIDVLAFDNSGEGGMDELEIQFCKPDENDVKVTVDYYLKSGNNEIPLGSTSFFAVAGTERTLRTGTNDNEINHMKIKASNMAGSSATVSDGYSVPQTLKVSKKNNNFKVYYEASNIAGKYFVYDFATQNEFKLHSEFTIDSAEVIDSYANLSVQKSSANDVILKYTPSNSKGSVEKATIRLNPSDNTVEAKEVPVFFIPASNVLYEDNFFKTQNAPWTTAEWKQDGYNSISVVKDAQETVYGYTEAYKNSSKANGVYTTTLTSSGDTQFSNDLVFDFDGRGFDLIGSVGPNSGTIVVSVRNRNNNSVVRNYMVDTRSNMILHQVPLVHCADLEKGKYTVVVGAMNLEYNKPAAKMSARTFRNAPANNNVAINALIQLGFSDEEIAMTEFINMNSAMPVAYTNYAAAQNNSTEKTVAIDAFRVYRSSVDTENIFNQDEVNVSYTNVSDATDSNFTGYMEKDKKGSVDYTTYRLNGGPANEIYLKHHSAIAIAVTDDRDGYVQVSARAVAGATSMNNETLINHNTEMYYKVPVINGVAVIANTGDNMLAVANLKSGITSITDEKKAAAASYAAKLFAAPAVKTFAPARFDVKLDVIKTLFNQYATLKVKTSDDVAYITVNGVRVDANNVNLNKWGIHDYLRFSLRKTFKKNDAILFEVVAYDKNGNASEPVIKK